jgi:DnaJ-class molecular chaperone
MRKPTYYEILETTQDASMEDVKKAYKKLALIYHPDKCKGDDTKFKDIQEAYQILSDTEKRFLYDFSLGDQANISIELYENLLNAFCVLVMDVLNKQREKQKLTSAKDINIDLVVTLDDIYRGDIKKIVVKVKKKNEELKKTFYVNLLEHKMRVVFKEQGDEGEDGKCSDVIVNVIEEEHPRVKRDTLICKYDLYIEKSISLYEFYYGVDVEVPFLDENTIELQKTFSKYSGGLNAGTSLIKGQGLPYMEDGTLCFGDLYIFYRLNLPDPQDVQKNPEFERAIKTFIKNNHECAS